ncbi:hypothetical protein [Paenibacillus sp. WC2504]
MQLLWELESAIFLKRRNFHVEEELRSAILSISSVKGAIVDN